MSYLLLYNKYPHHHQFDSLDITNAWYLTVSECQESGYTQLAAAWSPSPLCKKGVSYDFIEGLTFKLEWHLARPQVVAKAINFSSFRPLLRALKT